MNAGIDRVGASDLVDLARLPGVVRAELEQIQVSTLDEVLTHVLLPAVAGGLRVA